MLVQRRWTAASAADPVTPRVVEALLPGEAVGIECLDVLCLFEVPQLTGDGFVVIESPVELDVVAVYTGLVPLIEFGQGGAGLGMDVEYIQPRVALGPQGGEQPR